MRRGFMSRIAKFLALAVAVSVLMAACGSDKESDPLKLVPEGANLIAEVNVAGVLSNNGLASFIDAIPKDEGDPAFDLNGLLDEARLQLSSWQSVEGQI